MSVPEVVLEAADEFVAQLRRRQIEGSLPCAKRTAEILRLLITKSRHATPEGFLEDVRVIGTRLQAAKPLGATCMLRVPLWAHSHRTISVDESLAVLACAASQSCSGCSAARVRYDMCGAALRAGGRQHGAAGDAPHPGGVPGGGRGGPGHSTVELSWWVLWSCQHLLP